METGKLFAAIAAAMALGVSVPQAWAMDAPHDALMAQVDAKVKS